MGKTYSLPLQLLRLRMLEVSSLTFGAQRWLSGTFYGDKLCLRHPLL